MITYKRKAGTTDVSVVIRIIDATDGTPETGVVFNTSGIDLQYRREGAASTAITEATLATLTTAHSDGGFLHIGNGYYRLDLPDAACAAGATGVLVHGTVTGMVVIGCYIELVAYDPYDTVRLGLTALPNAAAEAAGGLYTRGTGAGQIAQDANGNIRANVDTIKTNPVVNGGTVTFPTGATLASTTNITAATGVTVSALGAGVITATSIAADAITDAKVAADVTIASVTGSVGSVTGAVGSVTGLTASDVGAIKAKTDSLTFTVANQVDANIQSINDITITGTGTAPNEFGV